MFLFRKNSWFLFYFITFIGALLLETVISQKYNEILNNTQKEQLYLAKVHQNDLNSLFRDYEFKLDSLANEYHLHPEFNRSTFNRVLNLNPLLLNIEIFQKKEYYYFQRLEINPLKSKKTKRNKYLNTQETTL